MSACNALTNVVITVEKQEKKQNGKSKEGRVVQEGGFQCLPIR